MKERPILFSAPMVRGLLNDTKTQTRRLIKPQPYVDPQGNFCWNGWNYGQDFSGPHIQAIASPLPSSRTGRVLCPYGKPGDRLWVRETWGMFKKTPDNHVHACVRGDGRPSGFEPHYRATDTWEMPVGAWRPSIHMPRWASRITLEITEVRVERLQDISVADAIAEGIESEPGTAHWKNYDTSPGGWRYWESPIQSYRTLWNSINGPDAWDANPWVWAVSFERVEGIAP
jgi:hypothetical protein